MALRQGIITNKKGDIHAVYTTIVPVLFTGKHVHTELTLRAWLSKQLIKR